jgi:hypothetical protein
MLARFIALAILGLITLFSQAAVLTGSEIQISGVDRLAVKIDGGAVPFGKEVFFCRSIWRFMRNGGLISYAGGYEKLAKITRHIYVASFFGPFEDFFLTAYEKVLIGPLLLREDHLSPAKTEGPHFFWKIASRVEFFRKNDAFLSTYHWQEVSEKDDVDGWRFTKIFQAVYQWNVPIEAIARYRVVNERAANTDVERYPRAFVQFHGRQLALHDAQLITESDVLESAYTGRYDSEKRYDNSSISGYSGRPILGGLFLALGAILLKLASYFGDTPRPQGNDRWLTWVTGIRAGLLIAQGKVLVLSGIGCLKTSLMLRRPIPRRQPVLPACLHAQCQPEVEPGSTQRDAWRRVANGSHFTFLYMIKDIIICNAS